MEEIEIESSCQSVTSNQLSYTSVYSGFVSNGRFPGDPSITGHIYIE